ncbi:NUDIX domain-containing protein [Mucilaginibacter sp. UR6-11]|uniref:NUDIX domain-containing protein n=1 Tax=Mucilaginibacter sp. UR6-11 TaxID=1435644 RepID=UPI001E458E3F|nr:NUDIX domain-containing protein [Mucilaginibacter sp. UR6-11]MCC8423363.1 NUDIX domain-containing protein [Mucilaginibacter sp. UR6-11]
MHISNQSAGILLYRNINDQTEVFLVHPGGPFFKNKDEGSWSIPKGEFLDDEDPLLAARREFLEETGQKLIGEQFIELSPIKQKSGKTVFAWAIEGDIDPTTVVSNLFEIEWPPKSGKQASFAEVDRADWFVPEIAKTKINPAQIPLIDELLTKI